MRGLGEETASGQPIAGCPETVSGKAKEKAEGINPSAQSDLRVKMVGATGFEPATPCTPYRCATKLRYAPMCVGSLRI